MKIQIYNNSADMYGNSTFVCRALTVLMEHREDIIREIEATYNVSGLNPASVRVYLDWLFGQDGEHVWQLDVFADGARYEIDGYETEKHETTGAAIYVASLLQPLFAAEGFPHYASHMAQYLYCFESKSGLALDSAQMVPADFSLPEVDMTAQSLEDPLF